LDALTPKIENKLLDNEAFAEHIKWWAASWKTGGFHQWLL
jgi:hypothetical protein